MTANLSLMDLNARRLDILEKSLILGRRELSRNQGDAHGVPTYMCDFQLPFFGAELYNGEKLVYTSSHFSCRVDLLRDEKVCRYSRQRGFVEKQTLAESKYEEIETYEVDAPILLDGIGDTASYQKVDFERIEEKPFVDFDYVGKSNVFIGNYLRLFWLHERKEYDMVLSESVEYFYI